MYPHACVCVYLGANTMNSHVGDIVTADEMNGKKMFVAIQNNPKYMTEKCERFTFFQREVLSISLKNSAK